MTINIKKIKHNIDNNIENNTVKEWFNVIHSKIDISKAADNTNLNMNLLKLLNKRKHIKVNLWKINKYSKEDDNLIIPGKVLGVGNLDHRLNICAIDFSKSALEQIKNSKSNIIKIDQIINKNNLKIII